ncbi:MAG: hypothetical protein AB7U61_13830, partial [Methylocystis sp.]
FACAIAIDCSCAFPDILQRLAMPAVVEGPKLAALSCGKPAYLVVLLHGPDSDGAAIIDQALNWAPAMPKADFVAAEAPFPCASGGRQWFENADARIAHNASARSPTSQRSSPRGGRRTASEAQLKIARFSSEQAGQ